MMKKFNFKKFLCTFFVMVVALVAVVFSVVFSVSGNEQSTENARAVYNVSNISTELKNELQAESNSLESYFNIRTNNPVLTENQTLSNFCWAYSSLKALETAFMIQQNEYHNFSDVGMAYLKYYDEKKSQVSNAVFNDGGNFYDASYLISQYGLLYESDFSNNKFEDITDRNYLNYEYLTDSADKKITERITPITLSSVTTGVLKAFIAKYGGVFAGIRGGTVFSDGKIYTPDVYDTESNQMIIAGYHAVCLIGYNDTTETFIALNSWGVVSENINGRTQYEEFNIPYSYIFESLGGFIIDDDESITETSNASDFANNIKTRTTPLSNVFTYSEDMSLTYTLDDEINFENVYVKIFKGSEDVTHCFSVSYDDANKKVTIQKQDFTKVFVGGTYLIKFYEDIYVVSVKDFSIYTDTEVSYIEIYNYQREETGKTETKQADIYSLMNTFASSDEITTYYLPADTYYLSFYFTDIFKVGTGFYFDNIVSSLISTVRVYNYDGSSVSTSAISGFTVTNKKQYEKRIEIEISGLSNYVGKMVEFEVYINSLMYAGVTKTFHFQIFVTTNAQISSSDAYRIEYQLNGGTNSNNVSSTINSTRNIDRYPNYQLEAENLKTITPFVLVAPTREGYEFLGWFTDPNFNANSQVYVIDATFAGDLLLYAKWALADTQLFDISLNIVEIKDYDGNTKSLTGSIVYGDNLKLESLFSADESVQGIFVAKYFLLLNNKQVATYDINSSQTISHTLSKADLDAGHYDVKVVISVIISHLEKGSKTANLSFDVQKKVLAVEANSLNTSVVYDGNPHEPNIRLIGKYADDDLITFAWNISELPSSYGRYTFKIVSLSNSNYSVGLNQEYILEIKKKSVRVAWQNMTLQYNGGIQSPTVVVNSSDLVGSDTVSPEIYYNSSLFTGIKNAGVYELSILGLNNPNYKVADENKTANFKINQAVLTMKFNPITERVQTISSNRRKITSQDYEVSGTIYPGDTLSDLSIQVYSEGLTATKSGTYPVTATYNNSNYKINVQNGTYTLTGYYYIDYILPNGELYRETVEEGAKPKGINRDIYDIPALYGYTYSESIKGRSDDITVTVSVKNYSWILYMSLVVVGFVSVYLIITRKIRRNKVS